MKLTGMHRIGHEINVCAKSETKAKSFALKEAEKIGKNPKIVSVKEL